MHSCLGKHPSMAPTAVNTPPPSVSVPALESPSASVSLPAIRSCAMSFCSLVPVAAPQPEARPVCSHANSTTCLEAPMSNSSAVVHFQSTHIFHQLDRPRQQLSAQTQIPGHDPVDWLRHLNTTHPAERSSTRVLPTNSPAMQRLQVQATSCPAKIRPKQHPAIWTLAALLLFQQLVMSRASVDVSPVHASAIHVN